MKEENRIRKDFNNEITYWWLRSSYISHDNYVAFVYVNGGVTNLDYSNRIGVVPAFVI